jgi:hypothetical protein
MNSLLIFKDNEWYFDKNMWTTILGLKFYYLYGLKTRIKLVLCFEFIESTLYLWNNSKFNILFSKHDFDMVTLFRFMDSITILGLYAN